MKFNKNTNLRNSLESRTDTTINYEGELAFKLEPLMDLYMRSASCLVGEPKFYVSEDGSDKELIESIHKAIEVDPEFVLKLAIYCREKLHLRSVPIVLLCEFANSEVVGTISNTRKYVERVIQRADELTEIIAYQLSRNKITGRKTKLPEMIKHGVAKAFNKFDEYQFAKYNRKTEVKLKNALFLTHPKPKDEYQQKIFDKITNDTLETPETWEVMRSTGKMSWHDVINNIFYRDGKVHNYMAILRNLRNCLTDDSVTQQDIKLLAQMISDKHAVLNSKQLPFRFLSAYLIVKGIDSFYSTKILESLETAVGYSVENIPKLEGKTLIATDVSGSMHFPISSKSSVYAYDIGIMLSMMAHSFCEYSITGFFGDIFKTVNFTRNKNILDNVIQAHSLDAKVGYSTNGYKVVEFLLDNNIEVDRIMIFTDCQLYDSDSYYGDKRIAELFIRYKQQYPKVKLYSFDLAGYGNVMIPPDNKDVCLIGGWSDNIFTFIKAFEESGKNKVIQYIKENF